jgi:hypothetical protein
MDRREYGSQGEKVRGNGGRAERKSGSGEELIKGNREREERVKGGNVLVFVRTVETFEFMTPAV